MTETNRNGNNGISLKVVHFIMIVLAIVIAVVLVFSTFQSSQVFSKLSAATSNYIVRQAAAHDLLSASDYLTEMVQRFTLEGDTTYLDSYFEEAFVSKRREAAITSMSENHAEESLIKQIQAAMEESQSLMFREYYAMKLVIDAMEIRNYPEQLRTIELKEEEALLPAEEKMELAQTMVLGKEYYARKDIIRANLNSSLDMLDKMMYNTRVETSNQLNQELSLVRWGTVVLAVALLIMIWLSSHIGTTPMLEAVKAAGENRQIPEIGSKEFRIMARSYNQMHAQLYPGRQEEGETNQNDQETAG